MKGISPLAALLFRSVDPNDCRWRRSPGGGVTFDLPGTPGSSGGGAHPKVLSAPMARQRRTLIRLSCFVLRTVPVVGQGEVMESVNRNPVTARIQIVFAFIVIMRLRKQIRILYLDLYRKRLSSSSSTYYYF